MAEGDYSGAEASPDHEDVTIDAGMLGGVTASEGDKIRFCVTGKGEDGSITGYFEQGDEAEPEKDESWEDGVRKSMSAQNKEGEI